MSDPQRIVSLLPSATEIVCALGFRDHLVGRSHECDFPPGVAELTVCSNPRMRVDGSSADIDRRVKDIVREGLSVYEVREDVLKDVSPDVIVTQTQCEVCAVTLEDVEQAVGQWIGKPPAIVSLEPNRLGDVWNDIERVAERLGVAERGASLASSLDRRIRCVADQARTATGGPSVACIEWTDPLMAAGNWMPELIELAGGRNLFGEAGAHSPWLDWGALREADPEVILIMPCGFDLERTRREAGTLAQHVGWESLSAVQAGRVYITDGHQFFNRPGPRLVESLEIVAEILHPEVCRYGHEGAGWAWFD